MKLTNSDMLLVLLELPSIKSRRFKVAPLTNIGITMKTEFNLEVFEAVKKVIESKFEDIERSHAMGGNWGSSSVPATKEKLKIVQDVLSGDVPDFLKEIVSQYHKEQDSEYQEYLRLKNKFEK